MTLNRLRTGLGKTGNMLSKWGLKDTPQCDCGHDNQTANLIVEKCQVPNMPGEIKYLHKVIEAATKWKTNLDIRI